MRKIAGSKGKVLLYPNSDKLSTIFEDILQETCGELLFIRNAFVFLHLCSGLNLSLKAVNITFIVFRSMFDDFLKTKMRVKQTGNKLVIVAAFFSAKL